MKRIIFKKMSVLMLMTILILGLVSCSIINFPGIGAVTSYKLVDTGQTTSYDNDGVMISPSEGEDLYGQDADYDGIEASFTDNGDGTVIDNITGLIWQQIPTSEKMSWEEAEEYCENLELDGYDDWRLPTVKELFAIGDFETGWPFLDTNYFEFAEASEIPTGIDGGPQGSAEDVGQSEMMPPPNMDSEDLGSISKSQGQFWTSNFYYVGTTHGGAPTAFGVNHATGHIKGYPSDVGGNMGKYVRAVRGESVAENNFIDNGDGTISDLSTGLMWMADDNGEGVEWGDALAYAEGLEYARYDDWKLPNVKELQSIVDYSGVYPAIDDTYFNYTELEENENYYYWTSTSAYFSPVSPENYYAWYVAFGYAVGPDGEDTHGAGAVRFSAKYADSNATAEGGDNFMNSVRCVRIID